MNSATASVGLSFSHAFAQGTPLSTRLPNPSTFQSGDLIWPKKPGAFVPYSSGSMDKVEDESLRWELEKKKFFSAVPAHSKHLSASDLEKLSKLNFNDFHSRYSGSRNPEDMVPYSGGGALYVGHVGILEVDPTGTPWVVEALLTKGVVRRPYSKWLEERPGEIVWHARLRDVSTQDRSKIVDEAKKHVDKPYDFWNFDLNDDTGFYCSKLVWLSTWRSLGFAVDGTATPKRGFWFSPKQLLYVEKVARLNDPGQYANA